jgi:N-acetylglucosamine-6-sulfatase
MPGSLPPLSAEVKADIRERYQQRLESLLAVDEAIGRILGALEDTGQADNTLVVFTSDNGFFHGEHRVTSGKNLFYEPSVRVPLILRGPGIPAGATRTQLVANIDLAPTFVQAAKAKPRRVLDGRSLFQLARGPKVARGRSILLGEGRPRSASPGSCPPRPYAPRASSTPSTATETARRASSSCTT